MKDLLERSKKPFNKFRASAKKQRKLLTIWTFLCTISLGQQTPRLIECHTQDIDHQTKQITLTFTVPDKDFIYKDFLTCSITEPAITLSPWHADKQPIAHYDSSFKDAKQIFNETFSITMSATWHSSLTNPTYLYCSYYRKSEKKINHTLFPLFFAANNSPTQEQNNITFDATDYDNEHTSVKKHPTRINHYIAATIYIINTIIALLCTDHKKYFALLIFIILVLLTFLYFFKKELESQIKIKELLEVIVSLLIMISALYLLLYLHKISTPLTTMIIATFYALYAGFFYIKKSTKLYSKRLCTFCTFFGILCISSAFLLSFKALQYADQQFNLF